MRRVALLLVSLVAPLALAATADLSVSINSNQPLIPPHYEYVFVELRNAGPDPVPAVAITATLDGAPATLNCHACYSGLNPDELRTVAVEFAKRPVGSSFDVVVTISSDVPDPAPANNTASIHFTVSDAPSLFVYLYPTVDESDPGLPFSAPLQFGNRSSFTAHDVVITADFDPRVVLTGARGADCTPTGSHVVCRLGDLPPNSERKDVALEGVQPPLYEGASLPFTLSIRSREGIDLYPPDNEFSLSYELTKSILVTNTDNDGDGSLRRAIETANASCTGERPCELAFHIDAAHGTNGVFTITPLTPLPAVTAPYTIDGSTQTRFSGDTNAHRPEVEISGAALTLGNGLMLTNCRDDVRDLAIRNFPESGILRAPPGRCTVPGYSFSGQITRCHLTGNERGIFSMGGSSDAGHRIESNVITGNRRSGIFIWSGAATLIRWNEITGNGASGIYTRVPGTSIIGNTIARHPEFGIAVDRFATLVDFSGNSVYDNVRSIDLGMDGDGTPFDVQVPRLTRAVYDPSLGITIVDGVRGAQNFHYSTVTTVELFATDRPVAEAKRPLKSQSVGSSFTIRIDGDLRGQFLTATQTLTDINSFLRTPGSDANAGYYFTQTSELSAPIEVK